MRVVAHRAPSVDLVWEVVIKLINRRQVRGSAHVLFCGRTLSFLICITPREKKKNRKNCSVFLFALFYLRVASKVFVSGDEAKRKRYG